MKFSLVLFLILLSTRSIYQEGRPKLITPEQVRPYLTGQRLVRVGLAEAAAEVVVRSESALEVRNASGRRVFAVPARQEFRVRGNGALQCEIGGREIGMNLQKLSISSPGPSTALEVSLNHGAPAVRCLGSLEIRAGKPGLRVITLLALEDYIAGVVPNEMPDEFHSEALKAQAIIARTYALYNLGRHKSKDFDLCSQVHCQVYRGAGDGVSPGAQAVRQTAGTILTYDGYLVNALYHSTCGGLTDKDWRQLFGNAPPYLSGSDDTRNSAGASQVRDANLETFLRQPPDAFCKGSRRFRWQVPLTYEEADRLVTKNLPILLEQPDLKPGPLEDLKIKARSARGRVEGFDVIAGGRTYTLYHDEVRWLFGEGKPSVLGLPSTLFVMDIEFGQTEFHPVRFVFRGAGWGHGLGMCQWGAQGRAQAGAIAEQILQAYYPGAELTRLAP